MLVPSPLRLTTRDLSLQLNACGHSPYATSTLTRGWICLLWICSAFVKCKFRTYSMILKILSYALYASPLSVQALESRSCISCLSYSTMSLFILLYNGSLSLESNTVPISPRDGPKIKHILLKMRCWTATQRRDVRHRKNASSSSPILRAYVA
jgi:hypothetical protein